MRSVRKKFFRSQMVSQSLVSSAKSLNILKGNLLLRQEIKKKSYLQRSLWAPIRANLLINIEELWQSHLWWQAEILQSRKVECSYLSSSMTMITTIITIPLSWVQMDSALLLTRRVLLTKEQAPLSLIILKHSDLSKKWIQTRPMRIQLL